MKDKYILLTGLVLVFLALISYRATYALFSDSASSTSNTFSAASEFPISPPQETPTATPSGSPTPTGTPSLIPGNIVVNEVFEATANNSEWVELYNNGSLPVDVSGWIISDNSGSDTFPSIPSIPAGGFAVVITTGTTVTVPVSAFTIQLSTGNIGSGLNADSGGDLVILTDSSSNLKDQMSFANDITVLNPAAPNPAVGQSISRIPNGIDTNSGLDWSLDSSPTIGIINSL